MVRRHFPEGWGPFAWHYTYNPYAHQVDLIDLQVMADLDLGNGNWSDPYINLYMRDGVGKERKLLGLSGGLQGNWKAKDAETDSFFYFIQDGLLERYWFSGLKVPGAELFGIEVRDDDGVKWHDWLMDPDERYYASGLGTALFDFVLSNVTITVTAPSD